MNLLLIKKLLSNKWTWIALAFLALSITLYTYRKMYQHEKAEHIRWQSNYTESTVEFEETKDELGRTQTRVKKLVLSKREIGAELFLKDSLLFTLNKELKLSDVKIRNLEKTIIMNLQSSNTGTTYIHDTTYVDKPLDTFQILQVQDSNLYFQAEWASKDTVDWLYTYAEDIYYWTVLQPTLYNKKGRKRFVVWRWVFPKPKAVTTIKSTNKNSKIKATEITVQ